MDSPAHIQEAHFAGLGARRTSPAGCVPLVIGHDRVGAGDVVTGNRHRDFFSLYVVRRGRGTHVIDGVPYAVARGDVYAMGPGQTHWFADCDALLTDTLHFALDIFDGPTREALAATPGFRTLFVEEPLRHGRGGGSRLHLTPERHAAVSEALSELRAEWGSDAPGAALLARALFLRLLVHLARDHAGQGGSVATPEGAHEATVAAAVRHLDAHYAGPLRIADVAARVFLSPDRFTEVFSQAMGRTPRDYLGHLRLERARALLRDTDLPIGEVALDSGFGDGAYFARAFRAATGLTPRDFRRRARG